MCKQRVIIWLIAGVWTVCGCQFPFTGARLGDALSLDDNDAVITISERIGDTEAEVVAMITDSRGDADELEADQQLLVNGEPLTGPDGNGSYRATVPAAASYVITVNDPTRGVQSTTIFGPPDFTMRSPIEGGSASLSGFSVTWSNPDDQFDVVVALSQSLFGELRLFESEVIADDGMLGINANNLADFQQGADLVIEITKINRRNSISGFGNGALTSRLTLESTATPTP